MNISTLLNPLPARNLTLPVSALLNPLPANKVTLPSIRELFPSHIIEQQPSTDATMSQYAPSPRRPSYYSSGFGIARGSREAKDVRASWENPYSQKKITGPRCKLPSILPMPLRNQKDVCRHGIDDLAFWSPYHKASSEGPRERELPPEHKEYIESLIARPAVPAENMAAMVQPKSRKKPKRKNPLKSTIAGTSQPAPSPQSFNGNKPWNQPSPHWAFKGNYEAGKLSQLGLEPGNWGEHIDIIVPPGKCPRKGNAGIAVGSNRKPFSWNWGLHTILARIPGGKAQMNVLYEMCLEWCSGEGGLKRSGITNQSCRSALTKGREFFSNSEDEIWRLADLGEEYTKKPGGKKGNGPHDLTEKNGDESSKKAAKRQQSEHPSPSGLSSDQCSTPATSFSSSPQLSSGNTQTPPSSVSPKPSPTAGNSSTAAQRTRLPSKRKRAEGDDNSEVAVKVRRTEQIVEYVNQSQTKGE
jgi:hypothetical protein